MNGTLISTVGWDIAPVSTGGGHAGQWTHTSKDMNEQQKNNGPSMLENWGTLHGWTGVGIEIDQSILPALVVSSLTPGCSAQKCGAIMPGDQVQLKHGSAR